MNGKLAAVAFAAAWIVITGVAACAPVDSSGSPAPDQATSGSMSEEDPASDPTQAAEKEYTKSQEQAIGAAKDYLAFSAFSKLGLIDQLSSKAGSGFPKRDAVFAVNHIDVDWNQQAVKSAKSYLDFSHFSCQGLVDQLSSSAGSKFTKAQATYAAKKVGVC
jgi:hypothetical protein